MASAAPASPARAPAPRPPRQRLNKLERTQLRRDLDKAHQATADHPRSAHDDGNEDQSRALEWLPLADHAAATCPVVFTPDGTYAFIASGPAVKVYSVHSTQLMSTLTIRPYAASDKSSSPALRRATVTGVLLSPSNPRQLVVAATDGKVRLWDYLDGRLLRTLELGAPILHAVANPNLPDQLFVALGTSSGIQGEASVYLVSLRAAKHLVDGVLTAADSLTPVQPARRVRLATPRVVRALALSQDGAVLASLNPSAVNLARTADIQRGFTQTVPAADDEVLTSIAFHPTENYFATGSSRGQIRLWYNVLASSGTDGNATSADAAVGVPSTSVLHWHAHAVSSLAFTPNGAYLLSGGQEAVLVLWQLQSGHQEYVPRLGAPIVTLTVLDGTVDNPEQQVAARLTDGSVVFIGSQRLKVSKIISGLKAGTTAASAAFALQAFDHTLTFLVTDASLRPTFAPARADAPVPLALDPSTSALVLPAAHPSSLQFYSPTEDAALLELEVAPSNRVTGADLDRPLEPTRVERVAFSQRDKAGEYWMATTDSWARDGFTPVRQLKLWRKHADAPSFVLSTRIDRPHDAPITSLAFSPSVVNPLLLTTSTDGAIKVWAPPASSASSSSANAAWACRVAMSHRGSAPIAAAWSADGSMFAVAHLRSVTLWSLAQGGLIHSFPATSIGRPKHIAFVDTEGTGLAVAGNRGLLAWDLLTLEETLATNIHFATLAVASGSWALLGTEDVAAGTDEADGSSTSPAPALLYTIDAPSTSQPQQLARAETRPIPFPPRQLLPLPIPASFSPTSASAAPVSLAAVDPAGSVSLLGAAAELGGSVAAPALPNAAGSGAQEGLFDEIFGKADPKASSRGKGKARAADNAHSERETAGGAVLGKGAAVLLETPAHVLPPVKLLWRELLSVEPRTSSMPAEAINPGESDTAQSLSDPANKVALTSSNDLGALPPPRPAAFSALSADAMRKIFAARLMPAAAAV